MITHTRPSIYAWESKRRIAIPLAKRPPLGFSLGFSIIRAKFELKSYKADHTWLGRWGRSSFPEGPQGIGFFLCKYQKNFCSSCVDKIPFTPHSCSFFQSANFSGVNILPSYPGMRQTPHVFFHGQIVKTNEIQKHHSIKIDETRALLGSSYHNGILMWFLMGSCGIFMELNGGFIRK